MTHGETPDAALVDVSRGGDLRAWEVLVHRHQEVVFRSAYLATRDSTIAEDVTKTAFVRAYRSLGSLKEGASVRSWLVGITGTVARSHLREMSQRRDSRQPVRDPSPRLPATPPRPIPGLSWPTPVERDILLGAFDGMGDEDRLILAARYSFGLSSADAASWLGIEPGQVDDRLRTTVRRLRTRIVASPGVRGVPMDEAGAGTGPGRPSDRLAAHADDQLGALAIAVVFSDLPWTPDVAAATTVRLGREAVAYRDEAAPPPAGTPSQAGRGPSAASTSAVSLIDPVTRPSARGRRFPALRAAVLVAGFAAVGFALAAGLQRWQLPAEVGSRVDELIGHRSSGPSGAAVVDQVTEAQGSGTEAEARDIVPVGEPASLRLGDTAPQGALAAVTGVPDVSIVGARTLDDGDVGAVVRVDWEPGEDFGPVLSSGLERSIAGEPWSWVTSAEAHEPILTALGQDQRYRFRVRAVDDAGREAVSAPIGVKLTVRDPSSRHLALSPGEWITRRGNIIKLRLIATAPDSSFNTEFSGSSVALVGPAGPTRGIIGVRVDGGDWTRGDLRTWEDSPQTIVFSQDLSHGRHSLDVRAEADGVAVDAVLIVRTADA